MGTWCTIGVEKQRKERELREAYTNLREQNFALLDEVRKLKAQLKNLPATRKGERGRLHTFSPYR